MSSTWMPTSSFERLEPLPSGSAPLVLRNCKASMTKTPSTKLAVPVHSVFMADFVVLPYILPQILSCAWLDVLLF